MVTEVDFIKADRHCLKQGDSSEGGERTNETMGAMERQGLSKLEFPGDGWEFIPESIPFTK